MDLFSRGAAPTIPKGLKRLKDDRQTLCLSGEF